jgi:cytochrome c553
VGFRRIAGSIRPVSSFGYSVRHEDPDTLAEAMSARDCWSGAILAMVSAGAAAGATDRIHEGQEKAVQCVACHGPSGLALNPMFPHLAGQNAAYLEIQLEQFKTGERYHPLMTPVAQALSDQDIDDLAAYHSALQPWSDTP